MEWYGQSPWIEDKCCEHFSEREAFLLIAISAQQLHSLSTPCTAVFTRIAGTPQLSCLRWCGRSVFLASAVFDSETWEGVLKKLICITSWKERACVIACVRLANGWCAQSATIEWPTSLKMMKSGALMWAKMWSSVQDHQMELRCRDCVQRRSTSWRSQRRSEVALAITYAIQSRLQWLDSPCDRQFQRWHRSIDVVTQQICALRCGLLFAGSQILCGCGAPNW